MNRENRLEKLEESGKAREKEDPEPAEDRRQDTVTDRPTVLMYLPEDLRQELQQAYRRLNVEYAEKTGEDLSKNKAFYPALIKAGIDAIDVNDLIEE